MRNELELKMNKDLKTKVIFESILNLKILFELNIDWFNLKKWVENGFEMVFGLNSKFDLI